MKTIELNEWCYFIKLTKVIDNKFKVTFKKRFSVRKVETKPWNTYQTTYFKNGYVINDTIKLNPNKRSKVKYLIIL